MSASRLERQIDAWIRWYPKQWRDANGAAIRGALLDQADADGTDRLRLPDRLALAVAGMSAREARRTRAVSVISGILFVALAVTYAVGISWSPNFTGPGGFWAFSNPSVLSFLVGIAAVVCVILAFPRLAFALAASAALVQTAFVIAGALAGWQGPSGELLIVFVGLLAFATLPLLRRRTLVVGLVALAVVAFAVMLLSTAGIQFLSEVVR